MKNLWLKLSLLALAAPAMATNISTCTGRQGRVEIRVTFQNGIDPAASAASADYRFVYIERGSFPFTHELTGKAVAWSRVENTSVVSMRATSGHLSSLTLNLETNEGTLLYRELLTQPTDPTVPPILRFIQVKCL